MMTWTPVTIYIMLHARGRGLKHSLQTYDLCVRRTGDRSSVARCRRYNMVGLRFAVLQMEETDEAS